MSFLKAGSKLGPWKVGTPVGEGACAKVYDVAFAKEGGGDATYPVVAKVIPLGSGKGKKLKDTTRVCNTLNYEKDLYNGVLLDFPYRPRTPFRGFFGDDKDLGVRYLVLERLGCDLTSYANSCSTPPSHNDIAKIGLQILDGMKLLHKKGFLFVDSKPQNFMLRDCRIDDLKFVDFGCAERWMTYNGTGARPQNTRDLVGTPEFASLSCSKGNIPTRFDDLESMCLVLISLRTGAKLPWNIAKSEKQCRDMMESHDIMALCTDSNVMEVGTILLECRALASDSTPDYDKFQAQLETMLKRPANVMAKPSSRKSPAKREAIGPLRGAPKTKSAARAKAVRGKKGATVFMDVEENEEEEEGNDDDDDDNIPRSKKSPTRGAGKGKGKASVRRATMLLNDSDDDDEDDTKAGGSRVILRVSVTSGDHDRELLLHEGGTTKKAGVVSSVGRGEGTICTYTLSDEYISDVHCSFRVVTSITTKGAQRVSLSVKDERTTNGTKVNGTRLARSGVWVPISAGDEVKVGRTRMKVVVEEG